MPIITDTFKKLAAERILADFDSAAPRYYIGLGRSQEWPDSDTTAPAVNSYKAQYEFRQNLQGVKEINDAIMVVPRVNWSAGTIYSEWDDTQEGYPTNNFYVMNSLQQVYLCLRRGRSSAGIPVASVVEPTGSGTTIIKTSDGYIWKYLYELSAAQSLRYLAANFMPVSYDSDVRLAAIPGQVSSIVVTNGGCGYSSAPAVTIVGNGTSATAVATVLGGSVVRVDVDSTGSGQIKGSGYDYANIVFSTGNATARPIIGPSEGFGYNPIVDLKSTAIMFNGRPEGNEGGLLTDQDFRQVGLLRNVTKNITDSDVSGSANALNKLLFSGGASIFTKDNLIVGGTSGAKAYIDYVDSAAGVFYHQDNVTGFKNFSIGESLSQTTVSGVTVSGSAVLSSIDSADVNPWSGQLLYIDNRASITRANDETQDIKIVIQL